jgi:hypothetical protein
MKIFLQLIVGLGMAGLAYGQGYKSLFQVESPSLTSPPPTAQKGFSLTEMREDLKSHQKIVPQLFAHEGEVCPKGNSTSVTDLIVPYSTCMGSDAFDTPESTCSCLNNEANDHKSFINSLRSPGLRPLAANYFRSRVSYMPKEIRLVSAYDQNRQNNPDLEQKVEDFQKQMKSRGVSEAYSYLAIGSFFNTRSLGLSAKAQNQILEGGCDPRKTSERIVSEVHKRNAKISLNPRDALLSVGGDAKEIEGAFGSCFTAEEFLEYRSFPDDKTLSFFETAPVEDIVHQLNANNLYKDGQKTELSAEGEGIKRYLLGNPLMAMLFKANAREKDEGQNILKIRVEAASMLKELAQNLKGKSPAERLSALRTFNSERMQKLLSDPKVLDEISIQQQKECRELENAKIAELLDTRPAVYDDTSFRATIKDYESSSCSRKDPRFGIYQQSCIQKLNLMCYVHENSPRLLEEKEKKPKFSVEGTLEANGFYHLTRNLHSDLQEESYQMTNKFCPQAMASTQTKCEKFKNLADMSYQNCIASYSQRPEEKILLRAEKAMQSDLSMAKVENNDEALFQQILLTPKAHPLTTSELALALEKLHEEKKLKESITQRVADDTKSKEMMAKTGAEQKFIEKRKSSYESYPEIKKQVQTVLARRSSEKVSSLGETARHGDSAPAKSYPEMEAPIAQSKTGTFSGPNMLPPEFYQLKPEQQQQILAKTEAKVSELKAGTSQDALQERAKTKINNAEDELISELRTQLKDVKETLAQVQSKNAASEDDRRKVSSTKIKQQPEKDSGSENSAAEPMMNNQMQQRMPAGLTGGATGHTAVGPAPVMFSSTALLPGEEKNSLEKRRAAENALLVENNKVSTGQAAHSITSYAIQVSQQNVILNDKQERDLPKQEVEIEHHKFLEISANQEKLKVFLASLKINQNGLLAIKSKTSTGSELLYHINKNAQGEVQLRPVKRAKLEDLRRNLSTHLSP